MKLSVSLSEDDVAALDRYVEVNSLASRSAAVQQAIQLLDGKQLASEYAEAFAEWETSSGNQVWNETLADGLDNETW